MLRASFRDHHLVLRFHRYLDAMIQEGMKPRAGMPLSRGPRGKTASGELNEKKTSVELFRKRFSCRQKTTTVQQTIIFFQKLNPIDTSDCVSMLCEV